MDFAKIKNLVRENGDKVIVMENGEPEIVIMSFIEYEKLARLHLSAMPNARNQKAVLQDTPADMQESDDDILHETEFMTPLDPAPIRTAAIPETFARSDAHLSDIRLEDLPI